MRQDEGCWMKRSMLYASLGRLLLGTVHNESHFLISRGRMDYFRRVVNFTYILS